MYNVSEALNNPTISIAIESMAISPEVKTILSLPLAIKLGLNRITSPADALSIAALKEPVPESFKLSTT
jgi:hypothetical protein